MPDAVKLPEEVLVLRRGQTLLFALAVALVGSPAIAQQFGIGATYGWYNDVEHDFRLQNFRSPAWEGWLESRMGEDVVLRLTYGKLRAPGDNVGQPVGTPPVVMPEYLDRIQYVTLSVTYLFAQGPLTGGVFAGLGGYGIRPESVSPELDIFRDARERVFGWHAGVDGGLRIYRGLSLVGRLTYHRISSQTTRSFVLASTGAVYRF